MKFVDSNARGVTTRKLAGPDSLEVEVAVAPRPPRLYTPMGILRAIVNLVKGLFITLWYFIRPSTVVTQQYPENRDTLEMFDRYRAQLRFIVEEDGYHRCTACEICETACPNGSIIIHKKKGEVTKKDEIEEYIWRFDTCTFCNACVAACPHKAIEFTGKFESAVYDRRLLVYNLNAYAGPHSKLVKKVDEEQRDGLKRSVGRYSGPIPLSGTELPGIPALENPTRGSKSEEGESDAD